MQATKKNEHEKQAILGNSITYLILKLSALYRKSDQFMTQPRGHNRKAATREKVIKYFISKRR